MTGVATLSSDEGAKGRHHAFFGSTGRRWDFQAREGARVFVESDEVGEGPAYVYAYAHPVGGRSLGHERYRMFLWLSGLPVGVSLPLVVIAFVAYGLGGFLLVRRFYNPHGLREANDGAPYPMLAGAAAVFLFGFTIAMLGTEFRATRSAVSREANLLMTLHEYFSAYPADVHARLDDALAAYVREIVEREVPRLAGGERPRPRDSSATRLRTVVFDRSLSPIDPRIHTAMMQRFLEVDDLRHQRLAAGGTAMTRTLWIALVAAAFLSLTANFLIVGKSLDGQIALTAIVSASYAFLFFVVVQLDFPFTGPTAISTKPFLDVLAALHA